MPGSGRRSPVLVSCVRPVPWRHGRTAGGSRSWSGSSIAKTRHWPKRPPCLCCQKTLGGLPRRRGRMTRLEDRQILICDIAEGARLALACALAGIDAGTLRRWKAGDGLRQGDRRPDVDRPIPSHALSEAERAWIVEVANERRFADTPPARIVPVLADEGIYIASIDSGV